MEQWYSNKELFEQINDLKLEFEQLRIELKETRDSIKKYNGLREQLYEVRREIEQIKSENSGKSHALNAVREWGGWIVAIISLIISYLKLGG